MFKKLLKAASEKVSGFFRGGRPVRKGKYFAYRPAAGFHCIYSRRRMMRKQLQKVQPTLRSGRQWKKFYKALRRAEGGFDFLKIPSFYAR
jgi:hypothetical protein